MQLMPALLLHLPTGDLADSGEARSKLDAENQALTSTPRFATGGGPDTNVGCELQEAREASTSGVNLGADKGSSQQNAGGASAGVLLSDVEQVSSVNFEGMDWGVVAIWCCPHSCEVSREEVVTVQPSV